MQLTVAHRFLPKSPSVRSTQVMDHFGIGFEQGEHIIAADLPFEINPGEIALFHGESGSGKSSLLRAAADELRGHGRRVLDLDELTWAEGVLIDLLPLPVSESMQLLSACGLGEAQLMLRTPGELSDGQRYRFRLAFAIAQSPDWILADEFTATLDRRLARFIAHSIRKLADRHRMGFLVATTHDDIREDLSADVEVCCRLNAQVELARHPHDPGKKKVLRSSTNCSSPPAPRPTGRTSLGGITAAITSG